MVSLGQPLSSAYVSSKHFLTFIKVINLDGKRHKANCRLFNIIGETGINNHPRVRPCPLCRRRKRKNHLGFVFWNSFRDIIWLSRCHLFLKPQFCKKFSIHTKTKSRGFDGLVWTVDLTVKAAFSNFSGARWTLDFIQVTFRELNLMMRKHLEIATMHATVFWTWLNINIRWFCAAFLTLWASSKMLKTTIKPVKMNETPV